MSRRLRFQVKPNLNLSSAVPSDEGKPTANTPIAEPKQPSLTANLTSTNESQPAAIDESAATIRSPSPRPQPSSGATDENVQKFNDISSATAQQQHEEAEVGQITPESLMNSFPSTSAEPATTETSSITVKDSLLLHQLSQPPQILQQQGNKTLDGRIMRQALKGKRLDRSSFTMRDLIYWTPDEEDEEAAEEGDDMASVSSGASGPKKRGSKRRYVPRFESQQMPTIPEKKEKPEAKPNAPQVKINADGTVTVDETSLVIDRREQGTATDFETVDERWGNVAGAPRRGPRLTAMSFRRNRIPGRGKPWSKLETDKFYRLLSFAGIDFGLMHELFPTRSRLELKRKYKRECTEDPGRLDRALTSPNDRHGPWGDLKRMIIERGRIADDEKSRLLLDSAREMIEEEDERIELACGVRKPSIAEASKIAKRLSKHGFGQMQGEWDDDVSDDVMDTEAIQILKQLEKEAKTKAKQEAKQAEIEKQRKAKEVKKRQSKKRKTPKTESDAVEPSPDKLVVA